MQLVHKSKQETSALKAARKRLAFKYTCERTLLPEHELALAIVSSLAADIAEHARDGATGAQLHAVIDDICSSEVRCVPCTAWRAARHYVCQILGQRKWSHSSCVNKSAAQRASLRSIIPSACCTSFVARPGAVVHSAYCLANWKFDGWIYVRASTPTHR